MRRSKASERTIRGRFEELKRNYEKNRFDFIVTELELAMAFANAAKSSDGDARYKRNVTHAKKAYRTAERFINDSSFTREMSRIVAEKMERLRSLIEDL